MDKNRMQIYEVFYKEFFTWKADNIGNWLVTGIMEFAMGIFMCIPYQEIRKADLIPFVWFFALCGGMFYLMPYLKSSDGGKLCRIYEKIKYLPISLQEID